MVVDEIKPVSHTPSLDITNNTKVVESRLSNGFQSCSATQFVIIRDTANVDRDNNPLISSLDDIRDVFQLNTDFSLCPHFLDKCIII